MRAAALALAILSILPVLGAAVSPVIHTDSAQPAAPASSGQRLDAPLAAAPLKTHLTGPQPFITILCKFADVDAEPMSPAYFEGLFGSGAAGLGRILARGLLRPDQPGRKPGDRLVHPAPSRGRLPKQGELRTRSGSSGGRLCRSRGRRRVLPGFCRHQPGVQLGSG